MEVLCWEGRGGRWGYSAPEAGGGGGGVITKPGTHGGECNKLGRQRREMRRGEGRLLCPEGRGWGGVGGGSTKPGRQGVEVWLVCGGVCVCGGEGGGTEPAVWPSGKALDW